LSNDDQINLAMIEIENIKIKAFWTKIRNLHIYNI
jgi:hypothetical protein